MATIQDVSPTRSTMSFGSSQQFTTGRMLSLASSDDGSVVFAGSLSSNVWVSDNGGADFVQVEWPQPGPGQFDVPGAMGGYCVTSLAVGPDSARFTIDKNPRFLADITGDGRADIVGFGDTGVFVALSNGDGTFAYRPLPVVADFGYASGGWRIDRHPRFLVDVTGDGRADIVGFGDAGVYVALSNGDGTFAAPRLVIEDFGYEAGGWRVDQHPRLLADVTGDGRADIVGFGDAGVYVALSQGVDPDGRARFAYSPVPVIPDLGYDAGWRVDRHLRFLADITGDGRADIVGFGDAGVYVALSNGDGSFAFTPVPVIADFAPQAGGWLVDRHPRFLADITGDGRADIVGFGDAGVYVALSNGDGSFAFTPVPVVPNFGYDAGGWRVDKHPRFLADISGEGRADIVGFGYAGVFVALSQGGDFAAPQFVLSHFGLELTVLALARCDLEFEDAGVWRSTDNGNTWSRVHTFPRGFGDALPGAGQLVWAPGTPNFVYAAGGTSLGVSIDGGASFINAMPLPTGGFQPVNHVAVATTLEGGSMPPAVYALADSRMFVSFDAGGSWITDRGAIPPRVGGGVGIALSQNESVMVVSPRSPLEVFVSSNSQHDFALWRGDYVQFLGTNQSFWEPVPMPVLDQQFSGNVFVAAPRQGHGDVLFYCPQRSRTSVAPLDPSGESDWHHLDQAQTVHIDLHGIFLSPDFSATFTAGSYTPISGTVWMASDGGIFRSTDGGKTFKPASGINTLSCVNIAGTSVLGAGPVLAAGTGDNDGFASNDGGQTWHPQNYGGGDDDCSFADPLRPHSVLVFTPRWDQHGTSVAASKGQTLALYENSPGHLPDIMSSGMRHMMPGPSLRPGSTLWNAGSVFGARGSRPLVLNHPDDDHAQPGDYVFIRFFGNFVLPDHSTRPNNLAVLLRTQRLRDITQRTDWDTPGGWRIQKHLRLMGDLIGNGRADIVGFGDAGVWTALSKPDGTFEDPKLVLEDFAIGAGGWRVDRHPRLLADLRGNGRMDIVGFGDAGVYVALSNGDGTFAFSPQPVLFDFGFLAGGWLVEKHPRFLADITGNGFADIVGFGDAGVHVALGRGDGTFEDTQLVLDDFGYDAGGWRVKKHPRFLADVTGDGRADIVGFGDAGVYVARSQGVDADGNLSFAYQPVPVIEDLGYDAGGWRVEKHPRFLADITGDGRADIVGFGNPGVFVAFSNGDGSFAYSPVPVIADFGYEAGGWRVDRHVRLLADVTGEGRADIVGFGDAGVLVSRFNADRTIEQPARFVIPNFGFGDDGPVEQVGPFLPDPDLGVVQASGGHQRTVFYVGGSARNTLWKWTDGMAAWQLIVPGAGAGAARRFFVDPYRPSLIYLLDADRILRSEDGGTTWQPGADLELHLTRNHRIPITRDENTDGQNELVDVVLTDMQFDPFNSRRRFAVGLAGAFCTLDGIQWQRLLDSVALRGRPTNCYFDAISDPANPALYIGLAGRGILKITDVVPVPATPISQPRVRTVDSRAVRTRAMPDDRMLVTLEDGSSFVIDAEELQADPNGGYVVDLSGVMRR
jgi:hypothetical protein